MQGDGKYGDRNGASAQYAGRSAQKKLKKVRTFFRTEQETKKVNP
jgi:hypothetical protein